MSTPLKKLEALIRELIKKEVEEASVTGNLDGGEGPPQTPYAFYKKPKSKKDKEKEKAITTDGGYMKVKEAKFHVKTEMGSIIVDASGKGEAMMKVAKALKGGRKGIVSVNRVGASKAKQVDKKLENVDEMIKLFQNTAIKKAIGIAKKMKGNMTGAVKKIEKINRGLSDHFQVKAALKKANESINEGKYHDYRNDESLTPKQKIGYSMREVRDKLTELDKIVKMNVRFKNEVGVDSTSYWKNTHNAMKKISERLVKLANKVGQLY